jgi:hypothetical protein
MDDLIGLINKSRTGETARLEIIRDGRRMEASVLLAERP